MVPAGAFGMGAAACAQWLPGGRALACSSSSAQRKIAAQCALVLEQLAALEATFRRAEQAKKAGRRKNARTEKEVLQG
ncbi:hypothetical protein AA18889_0339 [Acetobacter senegalensis DSM 18889]|nr:hypothetical protein AA18889_0339 [Acetobacter senegalensis DSM 18889]